MRINGYAGDDDVFKDWTYDGESGAPYWWDGEKLSNAGNGDWSRNGRVATFEDAPGFYKVAQSSGSLYYGDAKGGADYFGFKTFVRDRSTKSTIKEIEWYMRIDVPNPGKGGKWWSFVTQR